MIRTTEELVDRIAEEHSWRIREIAELRNIIQASSSSLTRNNAACRAGLALLYAHWEGFVKNAGTHFLDFVSNQRMSLSELRGNFVTVVLRSRIDRATESKKYSAFEEITNYIRDNENTRARLPYKNVVDTQGNLSSTALKEVTWCLGIDYGLYETKEKLIDSRLVGRRNHVAHGKSIAIDTDDFMEMSDEVIGLLATFRNQVENAAITGSYKAA